jgi:regulator of nucleoside diphosphate kinase
MRWYHGGVAAKLILGARAQARKTEDEMSERKIYLTEKDRARLLRMAEFSDPRDRGDLRELLGEIERAEVVSEDDLPADVITMNSRVRLLDVADGVVREYALVYPPAADASAGRISVIAPLGTALIGYREGDEIEWELPGGRRRFRVEAVLYQPEAAGDHNL